MSNVEGLVRRKDQLNQEIHEIETWRAKARLGKLLRMAYDPRLWLGFLGREQLVDILPGTMQRDFLDFLNKRLAERRTELGEVDQALAAYDIVKENDHV